MKAKKIKISNIKTGHRQTKKQHEESDSANLLLRPGRYRKGDNHSGGGGHMGGGGKKGRPLLGWEKGDVARDENVESSPFPLRIKSAKRLRRK